MHPPHDVLAPRRALRILARVLPVLSLAGSAGALSQEPVPAEPNWWDRLRFGGWVGGAYQFLEAGGIEESAGTLLVRPEVDYALTERDHLHATIGLASGDGLDPETPFVLSAWSADLKSVVTDINGSGRNYLLTAWYRRAFDLGRTGELALTGGLVDATEYLDQNAFSNDELTQFMNAALVNGPNGFAPSYEPGAVLEWDLEGWSVNGVLMYVGENAAGSSCAYAGAQLGYRADTSLGEGNYRLYFSYTCDPLSTSSAPDSVLAGTFSADQKLGQYVGVWTRLGESERGTSADYTSILSGGVNLTGLWGGVRDELGLGYAYLDGGNTGVADTAVFESYVRTGLFDTAFFTLDAQYMRDRYEAGAGSEVDGWVLGGRVSLVF
jgi:porin